MGFSEKQTQALRRKLDTRHVSTREANGRELSYIEGWYAISEANRIFGFDGWNRETVESRCALARENRGSFTAVYRRGGQPVAVLALDQSREFNQIRRRLVIPVPTAVQGESA